MRNAQHHPPIPITMTVTTAAVTVVAVGLLVAGTATGGMSLLAWGLVCAVLAVGLGVLCAVRQTVDAAISLAVDRTAIGVGAAIAEGLTSDYVPPRGDDGTVRLYS